MRTLTVTYVGAPTEAAPHGDTYSENYSQVFAYGLADGELTIEHNTPSGEKRKVVYPESKVIRYTVQERQVTLA